MPRTQEFRQLAIDTPLGEDVLLLRAFGGTESLGRPFEYELDLLSEDPDIPLENIVGQNITVRVQMSPKGQPRYFNGFVSKFAVVRVRDGTTEYRATMVPWLWFLTRTSDCRIFQNQTVPEIVKQVFRQHGFTDFEERATGRYPRREHCVQYNETDFNFVSRLMEEEGIFYYFLHRDGKHILVLASASSTHDPQPGYENIPYCPPTKSLREREHIREWTMEQQVQPGIYSHTDFDFRKPATDLLTSAKVSRPYATPDFEMYEYPGQYEEIAQGEGYARCRIEEYQTDYEVARGEGEVRGIASGRRFVLTGHPRTDQCQEYLVTGTEIEATSDLYESGPGALGAGNTVGTYAAAGAGDGANYTVRFTAIEIHRPYRPRRITPKPLIHGPQTAIVYNDNRQRIQVDEYGRVRVRFHWDRHTEPKDHRSCWIRVSQHWAGNRYGSMMIPHDGQEVIVEFLEGDPDRPIITGRVYNEKHPRPRPLPEDRDKTVVARDHYGNEIVFDATKGNEHIRLHSPHHDSLLEIGKSIDTLTHSDRGEASYGNTAAFTYGTSAEMTVGSSLEGMLGSTISFAGGVATSIAVGMNLDVSWGRKYELSRGPSFKNGDDDIVQLSDARHLLHGTAGVHLSSGKSGMGVSYVDVMPDQLQLSYKLIGGYETPNPPGIPERRGLAMKALVGTIAAQAAAYLALFAGFEDLKHDDESDWGRVGGAGVGAALAACLAAWVIWRAVGGAEEPQPWGGIANRPDLPRLTGYLRFTPDGFVLGHMGPAGCEISCKGGMLDIKSAVSLAITAPFIELHGNVNFASSNLVGGNFVNLGTPSAGRPPLPVNPMTLTAQHAVIVAKAKAKAAAAAAGA